MKFEVNQMKRLKEKDRLIKFMVNDLINRGHDEYKALQIVFNSEVLGDHVMETSYKTA